MKSHFIVIDLETTNNPNRNHRHEIIEIAATSISDGIVSGRGLFHTLVRPPCRIQPRNFSVSGISDLMVEKAPTIDQVLPDLILALGEYPLVGHNITTFDSRVLNEQLEDCGHQKLTNVMIDTLILSKKLFKGEKQHNLDSVMQRLGVQRSGGKRHRAMEDVRCTAHVFLKLLEVLKESGITTLEGIDAFCSKDLKKTNEQQLELF